MPPKDQPMRAACLLSIMSLLLLAACEGTEGAAVGAEACTEMTCPAGTAPTLDAEAETACSASASGSQGLTSFGASASAACVGQGSCSLICEPVSECCGGESWTETSYTCETPCSASECTQVVCPVGTAPTLTAGNETSCEDGNIPDGSSASAACIGSEECAIVCEPVTECCGGEAWTTDSYSCETPCAAACGCAGKCGTVTGVGCTAECGGCEAGQLCSPDNVCVDGCEGDVVTCGGECCGTGETCFQNLCCDPVTNCAGKSCGDDGCGGICEAQESIAGCAEAESCEDGQCETACACLGHCGIIAEEGCEADCGGCEAGQVCSSDNVCVDGCEGDVVTCGGECCGTGETCFQNLCCDPVANCAGKSCGVDGCGGFCETQESIPGCEDGQNCDQAGQCVASCAGSLPRCFPEGGDEVVQDCQALDDVYTWVTIANCSSVGKVCADGEVGALCGECATDTDCADDDPCTVGEACGEGFACVPGTPKVCDDGVFCNGVESCDSLAIEGCVAGTPVSVDDGVDCTDDACDEEADTVTHTPDVSLCEDEEACTENTCDVTLGCQFIPLTGEECDDGSVCTIGDACGAEGTCLSGTDALPCDDANPCTDNSCDATEGCVTVDNTDPCEDGLDCTVGDVCGDGDCVSGPLAGFDAVYEDSESSLGDGPITATADNGLVFTTRGLGVLGNGNESFVIRRLDPSGGELSKLSFDLYPDGAWAHGLATLPGDGGFVVVGSAMSGGETIGFLATVDPELQLATVGWTTDGLCNFAPCDFEEGAISLTSVDVASDGSMAAVGTISTANDGSGPDYVGLFLKFDTELNVTKSVQLTSCSTGLDGPGIKLNRIRYLDADTPDDSGEGWVIVGHSYFSDHPCATVVGGSTCLGGPYSGFVTRLTMNGSVTQCAGASYTLKDGSVWPESQASVTTINDIAVAPAGDAGLEAGYILVGRAQGPPALGTNTYGWMARYNSTLNTLMWERLYGPAPLNITNHPDLAAEPGLSLTTHLLQSVATIPGQDGFYAAGYVRHADTAVDTWLLRVDGAGEPMFDMAYGGKEEAWSGRMVGLSDGVAIASELLDNFTYQIYGASLIRTDVEGEVCEEP
jgi:hypothetical protein